MQRTSAAIVRRAKRRHIPARICGREALVSACERALSTGMCVAVSAGVLSFKRFHHWAFVLLTGALCSCDARVSIEPPAEPLLQNIVQGTPTTEYPSVVQVRMYLENGPRMHCSGSLVARDRVLTAAHCLPDHFWVDEVPKRIERVEVFFGSDASQPAVALRAASHWQRNPDAPLRDKLPGLDFDAGTVGEPDAGPPRPVFGAQAYAGRYDTAIVYLAQPAPETIPTLPVAFDLPSLAAPARIVGFGAIAVNDDDTLVGAGTKREGKPSVIGIAEGDEIDWNTGTLEIARAEGDVAAGCKEDSGGPLLMQLDGVWTVVATSSGGDRYCQNSAYYATVAESASFLRANIP